MESEFMNSSTLKIYNQTGTDEYILDPEDIYVPPEYRIEVYMQGLDMPSDMLFINDNELLIAESGYLSANPRVLRVIDGLSEVLAEGFITPINGIAYFGNEIYVSHKGYISKFGRDGTAINVLSGLPSNGDFINNNIAFGSDRKMYFGQGTATNSGVVGLDNGWIESNPFIHDYPGSYIMLNGQNFITDNFLAEGSEQAYTGAYSPYNIPNMPFEVRKGVVKASGSILRAEPDGTGLEVYAWGLRNPFSLKFDQENRLLSTNHGYDTRGSRPIANAPDSLEIIGQGLWYGWPDYAGGEPVTSPRFRPEGGNQPEFLLTSHPNIPPTPYAVFPPHSNVMGFDFCYDAEFGQYGDIYISEFGVAYPTTYMTSTPYAGIGHRVVRVNIDTRTATTFAINKSGFPSFITGEGGLGRPIDVVFGSDHAMYILDMGRNARNSPEQYLPNTGVIWRVSRI